MSFSPRPCLHCAGTSFHVIPGVQLEVWRTASVFGMTARQRVGGQHWTLTVVACTQCGRTETFTSDAAGLAAQFPGSEIVTTTRPG